MKIKSSRFGELQINKEDVLNFPDGILGFEQHKKFCVVDPGDNTLIIWLQSLKDENVAFPILEPQIFAPEYTFRLLPAELLSLKITNVMDAKVYTILTIPAEHAKMSANMKAPIIVHEKEKIARQLVLQDNKLPVKLEMYKELKRAIVGSAYTASDDQRRTSPIIIDPVETTEDSGQQKAPTTSLKEAPKDLSL